MQKFRNFVLVYQYMTDLSFSFIQLHTTINSTDFKSFFTKIVIHYIQNLSPLREDQNLIGNV